MHNRLAQTEENAARRHSLNFAYQFWDKHLSDWLLTHQFEFDTMVIDRTYVQVADDLPGKIPAHRLLIEDSINLSVEEKSNRFILCRRIFYA